MKIIIVDDDDLIKEGLKIILEAQEDMEVSDCFSNGQEVCDYCINNSVDIILMDIRMPIMDGVLATKKIKEFNKDIKILILTTFKDTEYVKAAMEYGAEGYILKNQGAGKIIDAIRSVMKNQIVFDSEIRNSLFLRSNTKKHKIKEYNITERESEILSFIGNGCSNKEIAEELFLSQGTVRNYITILLNKLNLRDRTQLALFYVRKIE